MGRLWLPRRARAPKPKLYLCNVPDCEREGKPFTHEEKDQYMRHVVACSKKNETAILEQTAAREDSAFTRILDQEQYDYKVKGKRPSGIVVPRGV